MLSVCRWRDVSRFASEAFRRGRSAASARVTRLRYF